MSKDNFEFQKETFENYKKTFPRSAEMKEQVLSVIEKNMEENENSAYMWRVFFEADKEMYRKIALLEVKDQAQKTYNDYISNPHPVLLKGAASLAYTQCENQETFAYSVEKEAVWLNVFEKEPSFAVALEREKDFWSSHRENTKVEYAEYYARIDKVNNLPIVATYEIFVPYELEDNSKSVVLSEGFTDLLSEIKNYFDSFGIQGYMDVVSQKCSHSLVEIDNGFLFKFECYDKLDDEELKRLRGDFLGQLSDGWGENASQKKILIGTQEVSVGFDVDNASEMSCKTNAFKNRHKF